ncbi:uncharacterized protein LOC129586204 [Paramacrobiotus metropolitanus]|uniref:uncharacterized protein LOC129586204 n=1 Tax=Paramacrobiotus metropolitanus TaxID=2943436 RepID=UPI002445B045|nr:uncharacterized protein LOC129586204 [Paramacrobiotus metropolitanus]XP_055335249.1 uncharacterized protein LOC129586204 [Paramacrobiotus metropolitanus]
MEVKVWVEGLPKTICGISAATTCQDVVYALAHATGKRGRFVLFERWAKCEKPLAPSDRLWVLLEQKGEFRHDVQFILRKTDNSGSQSRASDSSSPLPDLSPFQRGQDSTYAGNLRKTLTTHGTDWIPPKIVKNRSSVNGKATVVPFIPSPVKENNFPADLIGMHYKSKESVKESVPGNADLVANSIPVRAPVDVRNTAPVKNAPVAKPLLTAPVPSANGSLDVHMRATVPDMGNTVSLVHKQNAVHGLKELPEKDQRRSQLLLEIRQQEDLLSSAKAECAYYDRECALWEQRTIKLALEANDMENQIKLMQDSEKSVLSQLEELSSLPFEPMLKAAEEVQLKLKNDLTDYKAKLNISDSAIVVARDDMKMLHEQLQTERNEQEKQRENAEAEIKDEKERLVREIQELAALQEAHSKTLEDLQLNDQRMESTLLAKQLELDSLQNALKQTDMDSFLECFAVQTPLETNGVSGGKIMVSSTATVTDQQRSSPAPPVRKSSSSSQRILVLKRNIARDPQGMWV